MPVQLIINESVIKRTMTGKEKEERKMRKNLRENKEREGERRENMEGERRENMEGERIWRVRGRR